VLFIEKRSSMNRSIISLCSRPRRSPWSGHLTTEGKCGHEQESRYYPSMYCTSRSPRRDGFSSPPMNSRSQQVVSEEISLSLSMWRAPGVDLRAQASPVSQPRPLPCLSPPVFLAIRSVRKLSYVYLYFALLPLSLLVTLRQCDHCPNGVKLYFGGALLTF
jgi:hypothetical protein